MSAPTRPYTPGQLTVHHDPAQLTKVTSALKSTGRQVAFVPTMGNLHEGHLRLVEAARRRGDGLADLLGARVVGVDTGATSRTGTVVAVPGRPAKGCALPGLAPIPSPACRSLR